MKHIVAIVVASLASSLITVTSACASDLTEGEALYIAQCKLCHGSLTVQTGFRAPVSSPGGVRVAMLEVAEPGTIDVNANRLFSVAVQRAGHTAPETMGDRIAFAPPFGPNLRGIVGRPAGSVEGFQYSKTMMATLKGMEWTEAALNVWITNPQAWVPGVYMYYKQKDPEIRRKIILYLKANP